MAKRKQTSRPAEKLFADNQIEMLKELKLAIADSGKFWDKHPSWDERIENIKKTNITSSPKATP